MSRKYTILALFISIALWLGNSMNPPNGKTGAPGDGICTECHGNPGNQTGTITITGLPALIEPNTAYVLTITNTLTGGTAALAGMQMTVLNSNNQKAGEMTMPTNQAVVTNSGGRQYLEHDPALAYFNNMVIWNVTWTSPIGPANTTITAYAAGNVADGANGNDGDKIVTGQATGMLNGGGMALSVNINTSTNVLCFGGNTGSATATASGGVPPYTYNWSNGGSGPTISNIPAGTYTVTVTDTQSSTATDNIVITQPTNLVLQPPTITNVSCNGGNNGSITANPTGGTPPYNFAWSTGGNTATISNLTAGSYTLVVTDDNNCTKTANYMVTQPPVIAINLVNLTHESCAGESDGSITISTTGGVNPLFTLWSNGTVGNVNNNLEPGAYSVTVTDNNNCTKTASYTINAGGTVVVNLINQQNVTCPGGSNGSILLNAAGGVPPFTYNWSNGAMGPMVTNLAAGNYLVTVADGNGCETVKLYTISQPPPLLIPIMQTGTNNCFGDTNVDLMATPAGGSAPYTGSWSNGTNGLTNPDLGAGVYVITVTDAEGCTATASSTVLQPAPITGLVTTTDESAPGANDGTATANPAGGTPGYTYLWSNGGTTQMITGLPPAIYTVTVTDLNGCTATMTGQVDPFGCALDVTFGPDPTICEGESIQISPQVTGGSGNLTYLWSNGDTTSSIIVSTSGISGTTVTDAVGCQDAAFITVTQIILPPFTCDVTNESTPGANDGAITCDTMPGIVSYQWSNGATTPGISGLSPGQYCVTVTDVNSCTATMCAVVQPGGCSIDLAEQIQNPACAGDTGTISLTLTNALPPVSYAWSNGQQGNTTEGVIVFSVSTSGLPQSTSYSVTVTDAGGCVLSESYTITQPLDVTITIDSIKPIDLNGPGFIHITVSGGTPPYMYLWTDPLGMQSTGEDLDGLLHWGTHWVTVTDAAGCTETDSMLLTMTVSTNSQLMPIPMKVYPVPAENAIHLDLQGKAEEVIITGLDGRKVIHIREGVGNSIDITRLSPGWYVLRVSDGERWYIARFMK